MMRRCALLCCCICAWSLARAHPRADVEPVFVGEVSNVTVTEGSEAILPCIVENLGPYKVAWIRVISHTILTIYTEILTLNHRIKLDHEERQSWNLVILKTEESDRGQYTCQVNTEPAKQRTINLEILVPPKFVERSEEEVMAREGTNITLSCKVKGHPLPNVVWEREGGKELTKGHIAQGEALSIIKVSRLHMGVYMCTAFSPFYHAHPITRTIMLHVLFPPMIWIPHQLVFARVGDRVSLHCSTEAFPMSINYWTKANSILQPNARFAVSISDNVYTVTMMLVVHQVHREDFGIYKCIAKNSLASTEGVIRLYEAKPQTSNKELPLKEDNRKNLDNRGSSYRETHEEVRIKGVDTSYELLQNTNVKEAHLPSRAAQITNILNFLSASSVPARRSLPPALLSQVLLLCLWWLQ